MSRRDPMDDGFEARVPPHSMDAEKAILGAMILDNDLVDVVAAIVQAAEFYRDAHRRIYRHVLVLRRQHTPIDFVTLKEALARAGELEEIGGPAYLAALTDGVPRSTNVEHYARLVKDKATLRSIIAAAEKTLATAYDAAEASAQEILDVAQQDLSTLAAGQISGGGFVDASTWMTEALTEFDRRVADTREIAGVPTSFTALDEMLGGFQPGCFYLIAGRPSMGKTALGIQAIAVHAATVGGVQVAIVSLEMDRLELAFRILASEAGLSTRLVQRPKHLTPAQWAKLSSTMNRLSESGLHIDDSPNVTVFDIRARARQLRATRGLGLILVDYLQLMRAAEKAERKDLEVAAISRELKLLARELQVPVVVLSQLNRKTETRGDHEPQLSDLRDSGALEQDADVVIFPFRPEVYGQTAENRGKAKLIVAKHRNGPTGAVEVDWIAHLTRFEDESGMQRRLA